MDKIIYLDHAATTAVNEEVINEMLPYFNRMYGNASGLYPLAVQSKDAIENARRKVARAINARHDEIYFLSGGSEGDNLAIKGIAKANMHKGNHIITSKIEHNAVLETCRTLEQEGIRVTYLDVDSDGVVNLEQLRNSITRDTILISIMYANNEIGTIQPVEMIGRIARARGVIFHTDAVQAIGNMRIDVRRSHIDALTMSAHKFYGPKGIGAMYVRKGVEFSKLIDGGHHEGNKRAGTENVPGIVGIGKAIESVYGNFYAYNRKLIDIREYYTKKVEKEIPNMKINGHRFNRLAGNMNISFENVNGKELIRELGEKGICVSAGSACNTGQIRPSHVLQAIGLPNELARFRT